MRIWAGFRRPSREPISATPRNRASWRRLRLDHETESYAHHEVLVQRPGFVVSHRSISGAANAQEPDRAGARTDRHARAGDHVSTRGLFRKSGHIFLDLRTASRADRDLAQHGGPDAGSAAQSGAFPALGGSTRTGGAARFARGL